jgi:Glycosyl transferase family 2
MGLWMTIESCMMDLADTNGLTYEIRVCSNGSEKLDDDEVRIKHFTEKAGCHGEYTHSVQAMSPPSARQILTDNANGRYLFFFDNHCMVVPGYFRRALESMQKYGIDYLHSSSRFFAGEGTDYSYHLSLKRDFWTEKPYREPQSASIPYRIATAGHGGFVVRTATWKEIGGYYQGFEGYGGEETSTDLKAWRMGKEVWIDPQLVHLHWSGKREYDRHFTDGYYFNMLSAAYIVGGEKWLFTVLKSAMLSTRFVNKKEPQSTLLDIMRRAQTKATNYAHWVDLRSTRTLDEVITHFQRENIPY